MSVRGIGTRRTTRPSTTPPPGGGWVLKDGRWVRPGTTTTPTATAPVGAPAGRGIPWLLIAGGVGAVGLVWWLMRRKK